MTIIFAKAPGKIILFGEHAVVYGQPAIAIPVNRVNATARVIPNINAQAGMMRVQAPEIHLDALLSDLPENNPLASAARLALESAHLDQPPSLTLQVISTIPIAAGMGSSAAITIAIIRALTNFLGKPLPPEEISNLAYEVEKIHHGTPSGIDNHVIAHQKPVFFTRDEPIQYLSVKRPTYWVIADTGEKTPTREMVAGVRKRYAADPGTYNQIFDQIGDITRRAQAGLIDGDVALLGQLMGENQHLLEKIGVSSKKISHLIDAAKGAGAAGAKLSGGGGGGNIIALAPTNETSIIENVLLDAGAHQVITTTLPKGDT